MENSPELSELLERARSLPEGDARVALLEEAVRLADSRNDSEQGYQIRQLLIKSAAFSGYPEKTLLHFSWCLGRYDQNPELHDEWELLWEYKWVIGILPGFPSVSREKIESALEDMKQRYEKAGCSLRPVYHSWWKAFWSMNDLEKAEEYRRKRDRERESNLSDCPACRANSEMKYEAERGELEQALHTATPLLTGELSCAAVPATTYASALYPLFKLDRLDEANLYHRLGIDLISSNVREYIGEFGDHIEFLVLTDRIARALEVFRLTIGPALELKNLDVRFHYLSSLLLLLRRLEERGEGELKLESPAGPEPSSPEGAYGIAALRSYYEDEARKIAAAFDGRNGGDAYARRLEERLGRLREIRPSSSDNAAS